MLCLLFGETSHPKAVLHARRSWRNPSPRLRSGRLAACPPTGVPFGSGMSGSGAGRRSVSLSPLRQQLPTDAYTLLKVYKGFSNRAGRWCLLIVCLFGVAVSETRTRDGVISAFEMQIKR